MLKKAPLKLVFKWFYKIAMDSILKGFSRYCTHLFSLIYFSIESSQAMLWNAVYFFSNNWILKCLHSPFPFPTFFSSCAVWHGLQRSRGTFLLPEACQNSSEKFSHNLTPGSPASSRDTETVEKIKCSEAVIGM